MQSASPAQPAGQSSPSQIMYPVQTSTPPGWHSPAASQVSARATCDELPPLPGVQAWATHTEASGSRAQAPAPAPSQYPGSQEPASHSSSGSRPAADGEQVPWRPARLQRWQMPSQAPLQHAPSTQKLVAHSVASLQGSPRPGCGTHWLEASQKYPAMQSSSPEHADGQSLPSHARYPVQTVTPPSRQTPAASQVSACTDQDEMLPLPWKQVWGPQSVPPVSTVQAPAPSQRPGAQAPVAHSPSGSSPAGNGEHVPSLPDRSQRSQILPQELSQHTPSLQKPERHSYDAPHGSPLPRAFRSSTLAVALVVLLPAASIAVTVIPDVPSERELAALMV